MADRMFVEQIDDLQALLQSNASADAKVHQVTMIKSSIKQQNVPEQCIPALFEALRVASSNAHNSLATAGLTTLNHLITRLSLQEPKYLAKEAHRTLPLVIDKLGDQKEKLRALATHALTTLYAAAPLEVEHFVKNKTMAGKSNRAKEAAMRWVHQMHDEHAMGFKPYVPALTKLLEDADPNVRDVAKTTVIELFRDAPGAVKADLKKQLTASKVRPAIAGAITKEIGPGTASAAAGPRSVTPVELAPPSRSAMNLSVSVSSLAGERPITPGPDGRAEPVEPAYLNTSRELEDIFRPMETYFDGRETEQNWLKREESMTKLRCLIAGNAVTDFHDPFVLGLRALLDGIIKAVSSLRTSLSKEGCALVQDMAVSLGSAIDPMVELLMQTFTKLAASTKKISAGLANTTLDIIISNVTYTNRLLLHVVGAVDDKNAQPRMFATGWLTTLLKKEANHKGHLEHTGGLDHVEKSIKKGLVDPNPGVREKMRGTYWVYAGIWPSKANVLMEGLDPQAQKLLRNDPRNPDGGKPDPSRPGLGLSKSTTGTSSSKPSLRDTMMAQKKVVALAAARNNLPSRPGSAMAHFSPVPAVSGGSSASSAAAATSSTTVRAKPESSTSGMSGAPMRPARRRPELVARPATAGPYSVRGHDKELVESGSPPEAKHTRGMATPRPVELSPRRTAQRPHHGHASTLSESSVSGSPARSKIPKQISSPRQSPSASPRTPRVGHAHTAVPVSSPSRAEELTLVAPVVPVVPPVPSFPEQSSQPVIPTAEPEQQVPTPEPLVVQEAPVATAEAPAEEAAVTEPPEQMRPATPRFVPSDTPVGTPKIQVYEDPQPYQPEPAQPTIVGPVLEDKSVNEDAGTRIGAAENGTNGHMPSPDKQKQNSRLLDSGITKINAKSLDVHGFRKLQSLIRENKAPLADNKFDTCVSGLFAYLEDPLGNLTPEKGQDVKAQILATIRVLLKKERSSFPPHVASGLNSILSTRSAYDARAHIASGLEVLADDLVSLGDPSDMIMAITQRLNTCSDITTEGCRCLSTGVFLLRSILEKRGASYEPSTDEVERLGELAGRGVESVDSGVRMESVQLCVALHAWIGDTRFWSILRGTREDPKSLITYYIARKQQERPVVV